MARDEARSMGRGHRVPFIARWPGRIEAGSESNQTICQTDIMATALPFLDTTCRRPAEDSFDLLPVLLGKNKGKAIRPYTLHQTNRLAWQYEKALGNIWIIRVGGNNYEHERMLPLSCPIPSLTLQASFIIWIRILQKRKTFTSSILSL